MNWAAITGIWTKLPREVRIALLVAIVASAVMAAAVLSILAWESGYIRERLGGVATTKDLQEQTTDLHAQNGNLVDDAVHSSLSEYDRSLREYLDSERKAAIDTILTPMLFALQELDKRQRQMQAATENTNKRLDELPKAYDGRVERMLEQQSGDETTRLMRSILERLENLEQQPRSQPQEDGRRTIKQKF